MRGIKTERALSLVSDIGYDGVELTCRSGWDVVPKEVSPKRRIALRKKLQDIGLELTAIAPHIRPVADTAAHKKYLDALKQAIAFGHDLAPKHPPMIQSVLGGGKWEEKKAMLVKRLADWARIGEQTKTVVCIKPHRGGAMSKPSEAVWIIGQLGKPKWLRIVYDYSHYAFRQMSIESTVKTALKYTGHIAIKDTIRKGKRTEFALPGGSGNFDYDKLFKLFYAGGYRGDICCEVSAQVWSKKGYDPIAAARTCYKNIAPILKKAGIPRRS